jgi:hypothetical protein
MIPGIFGAANNGGEDRTGSIITSEACLAHASTIVHNQGGHCTLPHDCSTDGKLMNRLYQFYPKLNLESEWFEPKMATDLYTYMMMIMIMIWMFLLCVITHTTPQKI